jgi:hypothetical protein
MIAIGTLMTLIGQIYTDKLVKICVNLPNQRHQRANHVSSSKNKTLALPKPQSPRQSMKVQACKSID